MYWIYSALLAAALLVSLPYWLLQGVLHGKYRAGLSQRLGRIPPRLTQSNQPSIWIHAVSVGEVLAVSRLVEELKKQFPDHRVMVSTTTDTGQTLARTRFGAESVFYFPLDLAFAIRPYLAALQPELIVIAETEFWPNFLRLAHAGGARIAVVNARISDGSWPGYRRFRRILTKVLASVDLFLAQSGEDATRLRAIGAPPDRVQVTGNLKFDVPAPPTPAIVASLRAVFQTNNIAPVIVAGSTVDDEERILLRAFMDVLASHPRAVMILAPRHPERFSEVAELLTQLNVPFWRRSLWSGGSLQGGVLLLDTIGELAALYALADVAFVGGSLVPRGGHNIIEPARHGVPIVVGYHTENFRDMVALFQSRDAVRIVGPAELLRTLMDLISSPDERTALGRRALETLQSQMGATQRTIQALEKLMAGGLPARPVAPRRPASTVSKT
jgi:3-deoxy-D-manno-octulosonic-acid transferase